jgi:hypothetical protein
MKIRNGFVSNSSSSSFILIGEEINEGEINFSNLKKDEYYIVKINDYFEYGCGFMELNDEILNFLKDNREEEKISEFIDNCTFYKADYFDYEVDGYGIYKDFKGKKLWSGYCDQHCIECLEELKEIIDF